MCGVRLERSVRIAGDCVDVAGFFTIPSITRAVSWMTTRVNEGALWHNGS